MKKLPLFIGLGLIFFSIFLLRPWSYFEKRDFILSSKARVLARTGHERLLEWWETGSSSEDQDLLAVSGPHCYQVPGEDGLDQEIYRSCNPYYFECLFSYMESRGVALYKNAELGDQKVRPIRFSSGKFLEAQTLDGGKGFFKVLLETQTGLEKTVHPLLLPYSCREQRLEKGFYPQRDGLPWRVDGGRKLYIDQFPATELDVYISEVMFQKVKPTYKKPSAVKWALTNDPSIGIRYCNSFGKFPLHHKAYYAAFAEAREKQPYGALPPWPIPGKRRKGVKIRKMIRRAETGLVPSFCSLLYSKECLPFVRFEARDYFSYGPSGVAQLLGGVPEFIKNFEGSSWWVKAASFESSVYSDFYKPREFLSPYDSQVEGKKTASFRCMRDLWP